MLRQRSLSAIFIVAAALIPALFGHPIFSLALAALALIGVREFYHAVGIDARFPRLFGGAATALLILFIAFGAATVWIAALATALVIVPLASGILDANHERAVRFWLYTVAGAAYVAVPLAHGAMIRRVDDELHVDWVDTALGRLGDAEPAGFVWLVLVVAATWLTDTAAYLAGRRFGNVKLAPALSPGKTREGAIAGVVAGSATGIIVVVAFGLPVPYYAGAAMGLLLSVAAQLGDLSESLIKRSLGIKDMGALIPGHGGILDRIDALLFTLPVGYYLIRIVQEIPWP